MPTQSVELPIGSDVLSASLIAPATGVPAVLFVHGWGGSQERDAKRARTLAQLGFICLTFDLRGHGKSSNDLRRVTREDNLADLTLAYDRLVAVPGVDPGSIAVIGSSYGGYLACMLTRTRPVRWLGLRAPALYRDKGWTVPKAELNREDLAVYRQSLVETSQNSVLQQCRAFRGDVFLVESELDDIVPRPVLSSYLAAFLNARSMTYRILAGADHALNDADCIRAYDNLLLNWLKEMIFAAR
ncbi:alpha/beta hydrolase family protein [Paracoccus aminovorans]|uniref:alpha/beta hydrolase family protein n=1 Tax=Paracoccus aminovorans TaxID=34004 RepID=UPI000783C8CC|nr:alpha/beta fold hydrolase [Paracoccus aminovorans]MDQ7775899.1 alpha/beta fold hydrolase [Paracoccus aminovorans]